MLYFDEPVGRTTSKNSQRYCTTKRLIKDLLSNMPNCYVCVGEFRGYLLRGMCDRSMELHQRVQTLRSVFVFFVVLLFLFSSINDEISLSFNCFSSFNSSNFSKLQTKLSLAHCEKTCLTGPLEYKYHMIFVLVLGVICTLQSAVG